MSESGNPTTVSSHIVKKQSQGERSYKMLRGFIERGLFYTINRSQTESTHIDS